MRKLTYLLLPLLLLVLVTPNVTASPIKSGDKCKKIGRVVNSSGTELICKKKAGKRIWIMKVSSPSPLPSNSENMGARYTLDEVSMHNSRNDCWTLIGNKVYDLTQWVSSHPGGSNAILSLCGIDGTSRFKSRHGMDPRANSELVKFEIGSIAK